MESCSVVSSAGAQAGSQKQLERKAGDKLDNVSSLHSLGETGRLQGSMAGCRLHSLRATLSSVWTR